MEWSANGVMVAVTVQGQVHTSSDEGSTWTARGSVGSQPVALAVDGDSVLVATRGGAVLESDDGGDVFRVRYSGG